MSVDVETTIPIQSIGISPDSGVTTTSTVSCQVIASDVDGGTPVISYEWTVSGNVVGSAMQLDLTPSMVSPSDTVTCTATATDSSGGTASDSTVTVENTDPVFTADASITPDTGVITGTVLNCAAVATDIDDGSATLNYMCGSMGPMSLALDKPPQSVRPTAMSATDNL